MLKNCPECKSNGIVYDGFKKYVCSECNWTLYHNAAAAVMAILTLGNKILFTVRAIEPAKNKLDFPGGFIDPGESAEEAVKREILEELDLNDLDFIYLGSAANTYKYRNILYNTCDFIFHAQIGNHPVNIEKSEIKEVVFLEKNEIIEGDLAFKSMKKALEFYYSR